MHTPHGVRRSHRGVPGDAVTALFKNESLFGFYSIGLAIGFFAYFIVSLCVVGKDSAKGWMGEQ